MARKSKPYLVIPLKHRNIIDFKKVASARIRNTKTDIRGQRVNWLDFRCIQFVKGQDDLMFFKCNFDDTEFRVLRLLGTAKRRRPEMSEKIPQLYQCKLPVSVEKKRDLLSLCKSGIIESEHHSFYEALMVSSDLKDRLPEPHVHDSDEDTD